MLRNQPAPKAQGDVLSLSLSLTDQSVWENLFDSKHSVASRRKKGGDEQGCRMERKADGQLNTSYAQNACCRFLF